MNKLIALSITLLVVGQISLAEGRKSAAAANVSAPLIPEGSHLSKRHEVLLNSGEFFSSENTNATLSFNNFNRIAIGGAYFYRFNEMLEVGPRVSIAYIDLGAAGITQLLFLASARVNIPLQWDFEDSLFVGGLFGIGTHSSLTSSSTTAILGFEAGKRFALFPNFTWQPTFALTIPTNGSHLSGGSVSIAFRLLSASLVF